MTGRRAPSDADLAALLEDVAAHLEDPPRAELAAAVRTRLEAQSPPDAIPPMPRRRPSRRPRFALAGFAVVIALSLALTFSPGARQALADWFGLRGVVIEHRNAPPPTRLGARFSLGDRVSLAEARKRVTFDVLLPSRRGQPDEIYVANTPSGGRVSLLYRPRPGLPQAAASGVGLLVTEFRARIPETLRKIIGPGVRLEDATINGDRGYWLEGNPHQLTFADEHGKFFDENSRLAGNTLIWEHGPLTLRLESGLSKTQAIRIAESLKIRH
jgi:hypothetical protein